MEKKEALLKIKELLDSNNYDIEEIIEIIPDDLKEDLKDILKDNIQNESEKIKLSKR